jgi:hypothetical protein
MLGNINGGIERLHHFIGMGEDDRNEDLAIHESSPFPPELQNIGLLSCIQIGNVLLGMSKKAR